MYQNSKGKRDEGGPEDRSGSIYYLSFDHLGIFWLQEQIGYPSSNNIQKNQSMLQKSTHLKLDEEAEERLFESKLALREKKNQRKMKMLEGKSVGRWGNEEQAKYYIFLLMNQNLFEKKDMRRNDRVFKMLSEFIITRTPDQCRTHHQKIQRKYPNFRDILQKLSKQFGEIDVKGIIEGYKIVELQTSDSSILEKQSFPSEHKDQEQPSESFNIKNGGEGEDLEQLLGRQLEVVNEPPIFECADEISFFHEEELFCLMDF